MTQPTPNPFDYSEDDFNDLMVEQIVGNAVASEAKLVWIRNTLTKTGAIMHGFNDAQTRRVFMAVALYCAHNGSSYRMEIESEIITVPRGNDPAAQINMGKVVEVIRRFVTLRQFCMYHAKLVWNHLINHQTPPAFWMKKGYTPETQYAAFDFFDGVTHPGAFGSTAMLVREPTIAEMDAHQANRSANILRSRARDESSGSTYVEYTRGQGRANRK